MTARTHLTKDEATLYASGGDFCQIFHEDMKNLYLLSLLLTADEEKAEQCFVSGLEDCATGNQVFKEWARSWARRQIVKNAIRLIAPEPLDANRGTANTGRQQVEPGLQAQISAVLALPPFARFAFVMSVLEGYSDRECMVLLGCTRENLIAARSEALQQVARGSNQPDPSLKAESPRNRNSGFNLEISTPLAAPA